MDKDLEKTRALNELSELVKKEEESSNTYIDIPEDINEMQENKEEVFDKISDDSKTKEMVLNKEKEDNTKNKKDKKNIIKSIKDKWSKLSKKQKIIVGVVAFIILALIVGLIIVLVNNKKNTEDSEMKDSIVLAKDNYIYKDGFLTILDKDSDYSEILIEKV